MMLCHESSFNQMNIFYYQYEENFFSSKLLLSDCKDRSPICKSFVQLCDAPKRCDGKKSGSKEKSGKNKEKLTKNKHSAIDIDDDDDDESVCTWVRQQKSPNPALQQIAAKCDEQRM